jgi:predicted aminopeptidase
MPAIRWMILALKKAILGLGLAGTVVVFCGCNLPYVIHAGFGEARVLVRTVPMEKALSDTARSDEEHEKLLWVRRVREYARDKIGLKTGKSYLGFYDTKGQPAVWNLSASRRDALRPYSWSFPIVGKFDYLGYFDRAMAERDARRLEKEGYDTVIYGAMAYSTAGWLSDPFFSSLLKYDKVSLADTVIHELTHNTVFAKNDSDFTESVASFVGKTGSLEFLAAAEGRESKLYRQAIQEIEDRELMSEFLDGVYRDLETFYGRRDLSPAQKIAGRERVFAAQREKFKTRYLGRFHHPEAVKNWKEMPVNNARILLNRRYHHRTDLFEKVYEACRQDLSQTVAVFGRASKSKNAWRFMQEWLDSQKKNPNPQTTSRAAGA